jgi:hypothetical protein
MRSREMGTEYEIVNVNKNKALGRGDYRFHFAAPFAFKTAVQLRGIIYMSLASPVL